MAVQQGLYHPRFESDACGIGFTAHLRGWKSHQQIADALTMIEVVWAIQEGRDCAYSVDTYVSDPH
jgi:hypothetical protein